jgi:hypothetical protein
MSSESSVGRYFAWILQKRLRLDVKAQASNVNGLPWNKVWSCKVKMLKRLR